MWQLLRTPAPPSIFDMHTLCAHSKVKGVARTRLYQQVKTATRTKREVSCSPRRYISRSHWPHNESICRSAARNELMHPHRSSTCFCNFFGLFCYSYVMHSHWISVCFSNFFGLFSYIMHPHRISACFGNLFVNCFVFHI